MVFAGRISRYVIDFCGGCWENVDGSMRALAERMSKRYVLLLGSGVIACGPLPHTFGPILGR